MQQSIVNKMITAFNCQNDLLYISRRRLKKAIGRDLWNEYQLNDKPGQGTVV